MKVCPADNTPVVMTFERPGKEFHCLKCGSWFELFGVTDTPHSTPDQERLGDLLDAMFRDGARGPIEIPPAPPPAPESQGHIKCGGCGRDSGRTPEQGKPSVWYQRTDSDGTQYACSRDCINLVAVATGKTRLVLPW